MWKATFEAFCVLLLVWFFGNFVLGWFQHNDAKPQTQHGERPNRASDSQDQSCFCHVSPLNTHTNRAVVLFGVALGLFNAVKRGEYGATAVTVQEVF